MSKASNISTEVVFSSGFPSVGELRKNSLLIFDKKLLKNKRTQSFIEGFANSYGVSAGESLKSLEQFEKHLKVISRRVPNIDRHRLSIVALGGGSLGDFVGFVASVYHRGTRLIQIPTTWLAAIDSAHGGKNGLNLGGLKNQLGTIHFPEKVYVSKALLKTQPKSLEIDVQGEFIKHALLSKKSWSKLQNLRSSTSSKNLWEFLPDAIEVKYEVLRKDPFETKGKRHVLNLGHTGGHMFETLLGTSHGTSVALGLHFMLNWSSQRGSVSKEFCSQWIEYLEECCELNIKKYKSLFKKSSSLPRIKSVLAKDKKTETSKTVKFVFLKAKGSPSIELVTHLQVIKELKRQGWM